MNAYITKTPVQHTVIPTPKNRRAAQAGPHWERWKAAEQREWQGLWAMGTFEDCKLEHLPKGQKLHFLNWIYKCKLDKDKARLALDGRRQDPNSHLLRNLRTDSEDGIAAYYARYRSEV